MKKVLLVAIGSMLALSCNKTAEKTTVDTSTNIEVKSLDEHDMSEKSEAIQMNNGSKWLVNNEMKPFVMKGEELVKTYIEKKQTDYKTLATKVKQQNEQLIKSCTMDGASHDELHKWLHPHLELTKKLENDTDVAHADATVKELERSYNSYHDYFN